MSWTGRSAGLLVAAAMVMSVAACTAGSVGGLCATRFTYQDRSYRDVANVKFTLGKKLGDATAPPCEDTGGRGKGEELATTETAYEVVGISPKVAIALPIGDTPQKATLFAVDSGSELPPEVQKLIDGS